MADPPAADALEDVLDDALDDVLDDVPVEVEEADDEHPPISAAITATATPHATKRVRSSLDMVLSLSFREKGHASRSTLNFVEPSAGSAEGERNSG